MNSHLNNIMEDIFSKDDVAQYDQLDFIKFIAKVYTKTQPSNLHDITIECIKFMDDNLFDLRCIREVEKMSKDPEFTTAVLYAAQINDSEAKINNLKRGSKIQKSCCVIC